MPTTFLLLSRDAGENLLDASQHDVERLARHFRRYPSVRQLLTFLLVTTVQANSGCTCKACERAHAAKKGRCTKNDTLELLSEWLPGFFPKPHSKRSTGRRRPSILAERLAQLAAGD